MPLPLQSSANGRRDPLRQLLSITKEKGYMRSEVPFQLSSGVMSHDYIDMRRAVSFGPDLADAAAAVLGALEERHLDFDVIGGMTMGADPVAHAVALSCERGWYSVRKAEKEHGSRRRVEGAALGDGVRAVVFEDTTSTGRSILDALDVVVETGAEIVCAMTLLDRGELAKAAFAERNVEYVALLTYRDLGIDPIS